MENAQGGGEGIDFGERGEIVQGARCSGHFEVAFITQIANSARKDGLASPRQMKHGTGESTNFDGPLQYRAIRRHREFSLSNAKAAVSVVAPFIDRSHY